MKSKSFNRRITYGWLALSFVGFIDATYLTIQHFRHIAPPCSLVRGCEVVTTSQYATIVGIPLALLGALYYVTIFLLAVAWLDTKKELFAFIISRLSVIGFFVSLYLVYLQLSVLNAICLYCMFSALTSTLIFVLGAIYFLKKKQDNAHNNV